MTDTGTFIINGAERVIVSQLVPPRYLLLLNMIKRKKNI